MVRIDLFQNTVSHHGVLYRFTLGLHRALERNGIPSHIYNLFEESPRDILEAFQRDPPQYTAGFNVVVGEAELLKMFHIRHVALIVDSPTFHQELFSSPSTIAFFVDEDSARLARAFGHEKTFFLPHAIEKEALEMPCEGTRDCDVVFLGSFIDEKEITAKWQKTFSKKFCNALEELVEASLASTSCNHIDALLALLDSNKNFKSELTKKGIPLFDLANEVEKCLRGRDKMLQVSSIRERELHIFDDVACHDSWKKIVKTKAIFHPPVDFADVQSVLMRSKVVLNSIPTLKRGLHERLLYALAAGCSCISNENVFIPEKFSKNRAVNFYLPPRYEEINETIEQILSDEKKRLSDIRQAQEVVRKNFTWDATVPALLHNLTTESSEISERI